MPETTPPPSETDPLDPSLGSETPPRDPGTGRFIPRDETPTPSHPAYLIRQAKEFGLDDDEINSQSSDSLSRQIFRMHGLLHAQREQYARQRVLDDSAVVQAPPQPAPKEKPTLASLRKKLDLDEDLAAYLEDLETRAQVAHEARDRTERLEKSLQERDQQASQRDMARSERVLDAAFSRLAKTSPQHKAFFGDKPAGALKGQPEMQRRLAVMREAGVDLTDVDASTIVQQLKDAADLFLVAAPEPKATSAYQEPVARNGATEDWQRGAVARPTQRRNGHEAELSGDALAIAKLRERMSERGLNAQAEDNSILDGIPD